MSSAGTRADEENLESIEYDLAEVETRWEEVWRDAGVFTTRSGGDESERAWVLAGCASTSGEAHMGHLRSYTIADAYARFMRAQGNNVLFSVAFSSLGRSTEMEAIEHGASCQEWAEGRSQKTRELLDRLGCSFDWDRSSISSDADLYRWTQSLFLALLERDLIYRREAEVDWCDSCHTVLASFQTEDRVCEYCRNRTKRTNRTEWFLRVSAYTENNEQGIEHLPGWRPAAVELQQAVLGKVDGVEINASVVGVGELTVFTPHPDAIKSAAFVAVSPSHPAIAPLVEDPQIRELVGKATEAGWCIEDDDSRVRVVQTGLQATVPGASNLLPLVISASVDGRYGETAVLGIPERDEIDQAIAESFDRSDAQAWKLTIKEEKPRQAHRYRMRDFPVSRQRPWGAPIPVIHCPTCGIVPVPSTDLPVRLPDDLRPSSDGNPVDEPPECDCPRCGGVAKREIDTIDCKLDETWLWLSTCVPAEERAEAMFNHADLHDWLPVKQVVCGADRRGTVFDQRAIAKVLQDIEVLPQVESKEPFDGALLHQQICVEGREMRRHLGNGVAPEPLISDVGADAVRYGVLDAASPRKAFEWDDQSVRHAVHFLGELWRYAEPRLRCWRDSIGEEADQSDRLRRSLTKWCRIGLEKIAASYEELEMQRAIYNISRLFLRINEFEEQAREQRGVLEPADREAIVAALMLLTQALAPVAPHLAEELWVRGTGEGLVCVAPWRTEVGNVLV